MLDSINKEREIRLKDFRENGYTAKSRFEKKLKEEISESDLAEITPYIDYAESLDYQHGELSNATYLSHVYRTAYLAIDLIHEINLDAIKLCLIHNVLEVAPQSSNKIATLFGKDIYEVLKALLVDRSNKTPEYKLEFYSRIILAGKNARMIKVLDKLDNMFLLCLNHDEQERTDYLNEIETHVLPLVKSDLPHLVEYFSKLTQDCKTVKPINL